MTVSSRTPEGDPFTCRVCGLADRVEPSPITGDAVCPRCGGYLDRVLAGFDDLLGGSGPATLDTRLDSLAEYDSLELAERVERLGGRADWDGLARCETVEDLVRTLARLHDDRPDQ